MRTGDPAVAADLSTCDSEPIHIPASIQPHGALLVLREPDLHIVQASENAGDFLSRSFEQILHHPLSSILDSSAHGTVSDAANDGRWEQINPLRLRVAGRALEGIIHRHDGALILEFEPDSGDSLHVAGTQQLHRAVLGLQPTQTLAALCAEVVSEVRKFTGFERVVLYRFHSGGDGSVDAESKETFLDPYLGLHYPASDIPKQARELYRKNWLRIIPDAHYVPVRILPALRTDTGEPLDLSFSALRSVSPVHLEYMANQGVRASMSISLVVRNRLWGLISCANHTSPLLIPYEHRSTCETLGRLTSFQIGAVEEHQAEIARLSRRQARTQLAQALRSGQGLEALLTVPTELLSLVKAQGAAVSTGPEVTTCGKTPPPIAITALAAWLDARSENTPFATSALSTIHPAAEAIVECASGILTFALPGLPRRRLVWFRPEVLGTINWGGNPYKAVTIDPNVRIHPRRSFDLWRQDVRAHSELWTDIDIEAAKNLRRDAVEIDLERQVLREQRAVRARDDLVAVVSHDLRSPLSVIQMQAAILMQTANSGGEEFSRRVQTSAEHI